MGWERCTTAHRDRSELAQNPKQEHDVRLSEIRTCLLLPLCNHVGQAQPFGSHHFPAASHFPTGQRQPGFPGKLGIPNLTAGASHKESCRMVYAFLLPHREGPPTLCPCCKALSYCQSQHAKISPALSQ